jgi:hypothetical protein
MFLDDCVGCFVEWHCNLICDIKIPLFFADKPQMCIANKSEFFFIVFIILIQWKNSICWVQNSYIFFSFFFKIEIQNVTEGRMNTS